MAVDPLDQDFVACAECQGPQPARFPSAAFLALVALAGLCVWPWLFDRREKVWQELVAEQDARIEQAQHNAVMAQRANGDSTLALISCEREMVKPLHRAEYGKRRALALPWKPGGER